MSLTVVIPCFKDPLIHKTIDSLLENAIGEIEIIPVLDGYQPNPPLKKDKRVKPIYLKENKGMRGAINAGLAESKSDFIMKSDSHCLFGPGFDKMTEDCQEDCLMIPRRYPLNADEWRISRGHIKDYHYLSFPMKSTYGFGTFPIEWRERTYERLNDPKFVIDDTMSFQGSCYLANREYFMERVGFLDDKSYSPFSDEPLEVGLKYWLGGGQVKVNKKYFYAHLFKNRRYYDEQPEVTRSYKLDPRTIACHTWAGKHWVNNEEPNMTYPFSWLVERFWPVPGWPEDRSLWKI